jgi:hypothetical protein
MRASVLLFASLTTLAPSGLRAEPSALAPLTSPTAAETHPGAPVDFRWGASSSSTWVAGWVALLWKRGRGRFTEHRSHPGAPIDLLWDGSNSSTWFAGWVACSGAASDTKNCTQFDPATEGTLVAEFAFPNTWTAIESPLFGPTDGPASLFVAATNHGVAPFAGAANRGHAPSIFDDDPPGARDADAISHHSTGGWPAPDRPDNDTKAITATPEPATLMLAVSGFAALAGVARRRRRLHLE